MKTKNAKTRNKNKPTKTVRAIMFAITLIFVVVYMLVLSPALKLMKGSNDDTPEMGETIVEHGDNLINMDDIPEVTEEPAETEEPEVETPDPAETPDPEATATPVPVPTPTPDPNKIVETSGSKPSTTPIPYVADPLVEGVTKTVGNNVVLEKDATNVLILGFNHGLSDSIIVVSISESKHTARVFSLSRDAYVPYTGSVQDYLKKTGLYKSKGMYKLNACYEIGFMVGYKGGKFGNAGVDFLCNVLKQMMPNANMDIDDYVCIDVDQCAEFFDFMGGSNMYVTEQLWEPGSDGKTHLVWDVGWNYMNGTQMVHFLRTRYRYNENGRISSSGDPYRKAMQMRFMKDYAKEKVTIENVLRLNEIVDEMNKVCKHSINTAGDVIKYSSIGLDYANGKYTTTATVVTGTSIDPMHDGASYVNLMK